MRLSGGGGHILEEQHIGTVQIASCLESCDLEELSLMKKGPVLVPSVLGKSIDLPDDGEKAGGKVYTGDYDHEYPNRLKRNLNTFNNADGVEDARLAILKNQVNLYKAHNNFDVINEETQG